VLRIATAIAATRRRRKWVAVSLVAVLAAVGALASLGKLRDGEVSRTRAGIASAPSRTDWAKADAPPAGFRWWYDRTGYRVAIPAKWEILREGANVMLFRDPRGVRTLRIRTAAGSQDPAGVLTREEALAQLPGYQQIRVAALTQDHGAEWEYSYDGPTGRRQGLERAVTASGHIYVMQWRTPVSEWHSNLTRFSLISDSFRPGSGPSLIAVHTSSAPRVSMVIAPQAGASGTPRPPDEVSVWLRSGRVPATVTPVASRSLSIGLVIDTGSEMTAESLQAVQSGATEFLLRLPPGANSMVISAGGDPRIVAPLTSDRADQLSGISALRPGGARSTAEGVILAAESLAAAPPGPRVVIVFSNGPDESGPPVQPVTDSIGRVGAIVTVIQTGAHDFWPQVVAHSGGDMLSGAAADAAHLYRSAATAISNQYVVAFQAPDPLPTVAELTVRTGEAVAKTVVELPRAGD
jgi:hypothetical protein